MDYDPPSTELPNAEFENTAPDAEHPSNEFDLSAFINSPDFTNTFDPLRLQLSPPDQGFAFPSNEPIPNFTSIEMSANNELIFSQHIPYTDQTTYDDTANSDAANEQFWNEGCRTNDLSTDLLTYPEPQIPEHNILDYDGFTALEQPSLPLPPSSLTPRTLSNLCQRVAYEILHGKNVSTLPDTLLTQKSVGLGISSDLHPQSSILDPLTVTSLDEDLFQRKQKQYLDTSRPAHDPRPRYRPFGKEKPKLNPEKPHVRVNITTQGKTTRSGKLNQYDPKTHGGYIDTRPSEDWSHKSTSYEYNRWGELKSSDFSAMEMSNFLFKREANHLPHGSVNKPVLWIQRNPADSARRYPTMFSSKCRLDCCPEIIHHGKIQVGHFRVAIDEQWNEFGTSRDPFLVAGYVHLYCLERFLDFRQICQKLDVRVDERCIDKEPNASWSAACFGESKIAKNFIAECRKSYPRAVSAPLGGSWSTYNPTCDYRYQSTLAYRLSKDKVSQMSDSKFRQLTSRPQKESQFHVSFGDLERICAPQNRTQSKRKYDQLKTVANDSVSFTNTTIFGYAEASDGSADLQTPAQYVQPSSEMLAQMIARSMPAASPEEENLDERPLMSYSPWNGSTLFADMSDMDTALCEPGHKRARTGENMITDDEPLTNVGHTRIMSVDSLFGDFSSRTSPEIRQMDDSSLNPTLSEQGK